MNQHHIQRFPLGPKGSIWSNERRFHTMYKADFDRGRFKEDACIIDVNCRKFTIEDVVRKGRGGVLWERLFDAPRVKVCYIYSSPIQLKFEQARADIIELICAHLWFAKTQDRENEQQFRERMMKCDNMRELILGAPNNDPQTSKQYQWIGGLSFYGRI